MKQYFLKLYQYNRWANERVMACLKSQNVNDSRIFSLMGHVLVAQVTWLNRIVGLPPTGYKLWPEIQFAELEQLAAEGNQRWIQFVEQTDSFDRELTYKNFAGEPFTNNVEMIMIHVANHGTYHRSQIAMLLRQKGLEPVNTDFITYDRVLSGQLKD